MGDTRLGVLCFACTDLYKYLLFIFAHRLTICASKTLGGRCLLVPISATIVNHRLHVCWYLITLLRLETVYLLRRDLVCGGSEVNLLIHIHAGNHEEDAGAPRSPRQQPAQPEDDRPLVLLPLQDLMTSVAGKLPDQSQNISHYFRSETKMMWIHLHPAASCAE